MNIHDSEKLSGILNQIGYSSCDKEQKADVILLNTCSVREKAYQKVFSYLGQIKPLKMKKPDLIIGVCGCVAQQEGAELFRRAPYINFLMGPRSIARLEHLIENSRSEQRLRDLEYRDDFIDISPQEIMRNTFPKAYITIMEGCNRLCSYCIVPQTRGREVFRPFEDIMAEARFLADNGFLEFEFLGQNVNSYHINGNSFKDLLHHVSLLDSIRRLRFATSHPAHLSNSIMMEMKNNEKVCNNLHLPIQSGSNKILALMNRGYTREEYIGKVKWLKQHIKGFTLSTDIIVGFPGESEKDFQDTMQVMDEVEFDQIFSFAYSPRPNTDAEKLEDNIQRSKKMERLYFLQEKQNKIQRKQNNSWIGEKAEILVDGYSQKSSTMLSGRTTNNKIVNFSQENASIGKFVNVKITDATVHSLIGEETKEPIL